MKKTTIYLPEETETDLLQLSQETGKTVAEIIEEIIIHQFNKKPEKQPKSVGMGASGRSDLSSKTEELLWTEE